MTTPKAEFTEDALRKIAAARGQLLHRSLDAGYGAEYDFYVLVDDCPENQLAADCAAWFGGGGGSTLEEIADELLVQAVLDVLTEQEQHTLEEAVWQSPHLEYGQVFRAMIGQGLLIDDGNGGVIRSPELGLKLDLPGITLHSATGELINEHDLVSIEDSAAQCGVPLSTYLSWLVHSGMLLEDPDCIDPRCQPGGDERFPDMRMHVSGCECRFIPSPHPDIVERGR